jgi:pimeloyl-ACP methyl ester carboxylesterase
MIEPVRRIVHGPAGDLVVWDHAGDGPDALLLHGIAHAGRQWDFFARAVDRRLRLVAPDARGHGDSVKPATAYAPADFVADVLAILDGLGLARVVLVGHSMGGAHALAFTLAHPERVSRLVVIDTGPTLEAEGRERTRRLTDTRPARFASGAEAERYIRSTSPGYTDEIYAHRVRWLLHETADGLVWRSDRAALEQILLDPSGSRGELWDRIGEIAVPTLLVRGTRSAYLGAETARRMVERMPDARAIELDAGHNVQLDRPAELADAVVAFARQPLA